MPLLTNEEAWDLAAPIYHAAEGASGYEVKKRLIEFGEEYVRRKITSGELAVVKTARIVRRECIRPFASGPVSDVVFECSECGTEATSSRNIFCSVCGARIVE